MNNFLLSLAKITERFNIIELSGSYPDFEEGNILLDRTIRPKENVYFSLHFGHHKETFNSFIVYIKIDDGPDGKEKIIELDDCFPMNVLPKIAVELESIKDYQHRGIATADEILKKIEVEAAELAVVKTSQLWIEKNSYGGINVIFRYLYKGKEIFQSLAKCGWEELKDYLEEVDLSEEK